MADEIKNYGYRGIDTQLERDIINYDPILSYIKRNVLGSEEEIVPDYVPSDEVSSSIFYTIPKANESIAFAKAGLKQCKELLYQMLRGVKVTIADDTAKGAILKRYCGDKTEIDFSTFNKSCGENSPDAKLVVQYYMENCGYIEASAYPDIISFEKDVNDCDTFINGDVTELAELHGYTQEDIQGTGTDHIKQVYSADARQQELQGLIDEDPSQAMELSNEITENNEDVKNSKADPIPTITSLVIDRTQRIGELCGTLYQTVNMDSVDALGGEDQVNSVVLSVVVETDDTQISAQIQIDDIRSKIKALRQIMEMCQAINTFKTLNMGSLMQEIMGSAISSVTANIISQAANLKVNVVKPAMKFLKDIEKKAGKVHSIDRLANIIMDVVENISSRFDDFILDFHKETITKSSAFNNKVDNIQQAKWLSAMDEVLNEVESSINIVNIDKIMSSKDRFAAQVTSKVKNS